ncbi:MAG: hypothetical protein AAF203_11135, partial [Pseudomonadota bacterium]
VVAKRLNSKKRIFIKGNRMKKLILFFTACLALSFSAQASNYRCDCEVQTEKVDIQLWDFWVSGGSILSARREAQRACVQAAASQGEKVKKSQVEVECRREGR